LDGYAKQVSASLERLSYLQDIATQMTYSDSSRSLLEVAQSILPSLRHVVSAQAVALVLADASATAKSGQVGEVAVWEGARVLDEKACLLLVDQYRGTAEHRPVVKNRLRHSRADTLLDGLDSLVIVRLAVRDATIGWLVALQQVPPTDTYGPGASWELNDFEFGTDEAGLIGAAATLLAMHYRQSEMQQAKEGVTPPTTPLDVTADVSSHASVPASDAI